MLRAMLCGLALACLTGCPPSIGYAEVLQTLVLDGRHPEQNFEVTFCIEKFKRRPLTVVESYVDVDVLRPPRPPEDEAFPLQLAVDGTPLLEPTAGDYRERVELDIEGPWIEPRKGRLCADPMLIEASFDTGEEAWKDVRLELRVEFGLICHGGDGAGRCNAEIELKEP